MARVRTTPKFHSVTEVISEQQQEEQELWFYLEHIQFAKTVHEICHSLRIREIDLIQWANNSDLPVLEYQETLPTIDRHAQLPHSEWDRIDRPELLMSIATKISERATCLSAQIGCVITVQNRIVSHGYNGAPTGKYHCTDIGVCRKELMGFSHSDASIPGQLGSAYEASRSVHAEQAAICQAAKTGIPIDGGDCYCTRKPCVICHRMLLNCGIDRIFYLDAETIVEIKPWEAML